MKEPKIPKLRNAEATKRRLLDAARVEFAAHGIAGARVDRIAELAGTNKQLIYAYFQSKEGLFDTVYDAMVVEIMAGVTLEAGDLPGYAGKLFDWYEAHPQVLRLATWQQLEGRASTDQSRADRKATLEKIREIREAQEAGTVTSAIPAEYLLLLVIRLTTTQLDQVQMTKKQGAGLREALVRAVRRVVAP
jgi:AcrR family transcriptional regulator